MNDMSILIARGRATGNAELLEVPTNSGSKFGKLRFAIAINSSYNQRGTDGKVVKVDQVNYHNCVKTYNFDEKGNLPKHAYDMKAMILKGRKVTIKGQVKTRIFKTKEYPDLNQYATEVDLNGYDSHLEVDLPPRTTTDGDAVQGGATSIEGNPYDTTAPQQEQPVEQAMEQHLDEKPF